jgi:uncharacterized damage-inducible protein DinB
MPECSASRLFITNLLRTDRGSEIRAIKSYSLGITSGNSHLPRQPGPLAEIHEPVLDRRIGDRVFDEPFELILRRSLMPVPAAIEAAAQNYRYNSKFLTGTVKDLSEEEWHRRPTDTMNDVAWIVGHVIWARKALLSRLGTEWSQPWLSLFARGTKLSDAASCPSPETLMAAWTESSGVLAHAMENVSEEVVLQPATSGPPSADGKVSGIVNFLAIHETYHIGQVSYLRCWMGHKGMMG